MLVVDDEQVLLDTLKMILDMSGYDTRVAHSGETAVELARSFQPEVFITDALMPGISGIEAAIQVREMLPGCKIVLFSGQSATADLIESARAQGHQFELLVKPVHPADLLAKLRKITAA